MTAECVLGCGQLQNVLWGLNMTAECVLGSGHMDMTAECVVGS